MRMSVAIAVLSPLVCGLWSVEARAQNAFADLVSTHAMTASDDYRIGSSYIELSGWLYGRVEDPAIVRRVEGLTRRVVAVSDRPDLIVNVIVSDVDEVNASAYPGGFLVVNRAAVELFDDEELTFVIAHELAHVILRHYATTENLRQATQTLSVAEKAMTATDRTEAEAAVEELTKMMARYDRQLEFEADLYGLLYTVRAGVPAEAGLRAMGKLEGAVGDIPAEFAEVAGHPTFTERKAELSRGLDAMRKTHRKFDLGIAGLSADLHDLAIDALQEFLTLYPRSTAGWTNLAAAHLGKGLEARSGDDPWVDAVPFRVDNDVTLRAAADVHFDRARDACATAMRIDPNAPHCLVMAAVLARHDGDLASARTLLSRAATLHETPMLELLIDRAIVEASAGRLSEADALLAQAVKPQDGVPPALLDARLVVNRAVLREKQGRVDEALADWQLLLQRGLYDRRARAAITRLAPPDDHATVVKGAAADGPDVSLGGLSLGADPKAVAARLGPPPVTEGDAIGLNVYQVWPDRGVSVLLSADAAVGMECWAPCDLVLSTPEGEVRVGTAFDPTLALLGPPTELVRSPLFGEDRTAYYDALGLTVHETAGRVGRIALWER
jgi:predicted Zn-dependent protease